MKSSKALAFHGSLPPETNQIHAAKADLATIVFHPLLELLDFRLAQKIMHLINPRKCCLQGRLKSKVHAFYTSMLAN